MAQGPHRAKCGYHAWHKTARGVALLRLFNSLYGHNVLPNNLGSVSPAKAPTRRDGQSLDRRASPLIPV